MPPEEDNRVRDLDVLIVGGGISGLTAAYYLAQKGVNTLVVEQDAIPGGRTRSREIAGLRIDLHAQFFANFYKRSLALIDALNLMEQLVWIQKPSGLVVENHIYAFPPHSAELLRLLPWTSRFRLAKLMLSVLYHARRLSVDDVLASHPLDTESVAGFAGEHLDDASLNYIIAPLLRGFFYWEVRDTTRAFLYILFKHAITYRLFSLRGGNGILAETLSRRVNVQLRTRVMNARYDQAANRWKTRVEADQMAWEIESKTVICTVPAPHVSSIFPSLPEQSRAFFDGIRYSTNTTTHLFLAAQLTLPYYALFYPPVQFSRIAVALLPGRKRDARYANGRDAISIFPSHRYSVELGRLGSEAIKDEMLAELATLHPFRGLDLARLVDHFEVTRVENALPIFEAGYIRKLVDFQARISAQLPPGLYFAGDYIGGPSIEGAVVSSERVVDEVAKYLQRHH